MNRLNNPTQIRIVDKDRPSFMLKLMLAGTLVLGGTVGLAGCGGTDDIAQSGSAEAPSAENPVDPVANPEGPDAEGNGPDAVADVLPEEIPEPENMEPDNPDSESVRERAIEVAKNLLRAGRAAEITSIKLFETKENEDGTSKFYPFNVYYIDKDGNSAATFE
jgi:hypothetical protein